MRWQIKRAFDMKTIGFVVVHMFIIVINIYTTDYTYVDVELVVKSNTIQQSMNSHTNVHAQQIY